MKYILQFRCSIIFLALIFITLSGFSQTTYTVTSADKRGPGSFLEAVDLANNNPGADIIEFTPGLQVNATHPLFSGTSNTFMAHITQSH